MSRYEMEEVQANKRSVVFVILEAPAVFVGLAIFYLFPTGVVGALVIAAEIVWGGMVVLKLLNDKQKELAEKPEKIARVELINEARGLGKDIGQRKVQR